MSTSIPTADFSLLLPVYAGDDPGFLRLAFESSVDLQTLRPAEAVIVQDGPVPEALAAELTRIERESPIPVNIVRLPENVGIARALNEGVAACKYAVVARMDADDVSFPERFEKQWAAMQQGYDALGTGLVEFDEDPDLPGARRVPPVGSDRIREHARTHSPFNHPTLMFRVDAVERAGGYQQFGRMEDYWLAVRLLDTGARFENLPEPLLSYRVGTGAFARRGGFDEARAELRIQNKLLAMKFVTPVEYARNVVMKCTYRLLPAGVKQVLYRRFVGGGLPGDRRA